MTNPEPSSGGYISIPAPARGRTRNRSSPGRSSTISIPAPARGRTTSNNVSIVAVLGISIPAPARGRTRLRLATPSLWTYFNSRPREGANLGCLLVLRQQKNFNSRPREGANKANPQHTDNYIISIPAPARGRTLWPVPGASPETDFNSRPREGANLCLLFFGLSDGISIPAPARGRTATRWRNGVIVGISIPAPARGRTEPEKDFQWINRFQFPPPRGGERFNDAPC